MGNARSFTANKQMRGGFRATSEGMQWVLGEAEAKGFDGEQTHFLVYFLKPIV